MVHLRRQRARWYFPGVAGTFLVAVATYALLAGGPLSIQPSGASPPWSQHQIVVGLAGAGNPDGADGVDMSDVDGDGLLDVATGHEQGLKLTLSFNPGTSAVESPWPTVTLPAAGNLCTAEDAVIADVDADGTKDIVVACETGTDRIMIFYGPTPPTTRAAMLVAANWTQVNVTASAGKRSMRVAVADITGTSAKELIVGGKESSGPCVHAAISFYGTATPRTAASWTQTEIEPAGWIMQLYVANVDGDSDLDIVYSDRERIDCDPSDTPGVDNTRRGVRWLRNDGGGTAWTAFQISTSEEDHKWFDLVDLDGDTDLDILDCRSSDTVNVSQAFINGGNFGSFSTTAISQPSAVGQCQHGRAIDYNNDGKLDYFWSYSNAASLSGLAGQKNTGTIAAQALTKVQVAGVISGNDTKFDNLEFADVDQDGDLDAVTSEQHVPNGNGPGLGVVYYENPTIAFSPPASPPAVTCTLLTAGSSTTDGTVFNTASVTPTANAAIYVSVQSAVGTGPLAPTTAGNGITYDQEETVTFSTRRLTVFRGMSATPSAGQITFTFGVAQTSAIWTVIECTGVDTGGTNASTATIQSVTATVAAGTTLTTTLAALGGANNRILTWTGLDISSNVVVDADFVELSDGSVAAGASTLESQTALNQTTTTPTFASANAGAISIEVKIAP